VSAFLLCLALAHPYTLPSFSPHRLPSNVGACSSVQHVQPGSYLRISPCSMFRLCVLCSSQSRVRPRAHTSQNKACSSMHFASTCMRTWSRSSGPASLASRSSAPARARPACMHATCRHVHMHATCHTFRSSDWTHPRHVAPHCGAPAMSGASQQAKFAQPVTLGAASPAHGAMRTAHAAPRSLRRRR